MEPAPEFPIHVELKPNRNLLDPHFNGYKLSLDKLPTYTVSVKTGIDQAHPSEQQYSLQHVKQFATHNHIFSDPCNPFVVYIIDKLWTILRFSIDFTTGRLDLISELWKIPKPRNLPKEGRFNITLSFPDMDHAVISDGCETLYIAKTGDRKSSEPWNPIMTLAPFKDKISHQFSLLDSIKYKAGNSDFVDVLVVRIEEKNEWKEILKNIEDPALTTHNFLTVLEWFTFQGVEQTKWVLKSQRTLLGTSAADYAYLEPGGTGVYLASVGKFYMVVDTEKAINLSRPISEKKNMEAKAREYVWMQSEEEIKLWFRVPFNVNKTDVDVEFKRDSISVSYKKCPTLEGLLTNSVNVEGCYWIIDTPSTCLPAEATVIEAQNSESCAKAEAGKYKILEIVLEKSDRGSVWVGQIVKENCAGQEVSDPEFIANIHSKLAHLCSDKWGVDPEVSDSYDPRQLEECDDYPADSSSFMRIDRVLQKLTHQASLGSHQWLFNVRLEPNEAPGICIRHDVDGVVWAPQISCQRQDVSTTAEGAVNNINWNCEHIGTFSALGYVQASKQQRKYTLCSSDISYVAICDVKKHIYIYRQPAKLESCLRNRRTGEHVTHVAKQLVISLDPPCDILGAYATPSYLYVLTPENFHAIRVLAEEE